MPTGSVVVPDVSQPMVRQKWALGHGAYSFLKILVGHTYVGHYAQTQNVTEAAICMGHYVTGQF